MSEGMPTELIVAIITAGMSAAASVIAALIQAGRGKERAASAQAPAPEPKRGLTGMITRVDFGRAPTGRKGVDGVWLAVTFILAIEIVVLSTHNPEATAVLNSVILIPAVTILLALARPVGWGYAAGAVTVLHVVVLASSMVLGHRGWESSPEVFFLSFVANALLVGGIAFLRTRARPAALGGTLVAAGVGALAWLFVPMLVPMGGRPPEPHEPHEAEMLRDRERAEMEREREREREMERERARGREKGPRRPVRIDPDAIKVRPEVRRVQSVPQTSRTIKLRWARPQQMQRIQQMPREER